MAEGEPKKPEAPVRKPTSPDQKVQTLEAVVDDAAKDAHLNTAGIQKLKAKVAAEQLRIPMENAQERAKMKESIREAIGKTEKKGSEYLGDIVNTVLKRNKAHAEINKLPGLTEKIEDLRKLDANALVKLEDKYPGVLLYVFTDFADAKDKVDFKNWEGYAKPANGMKLKVNFLGNDDAEKLLGGADLLPPSVRRISVHENGDEKNIRTSDRRVGLKGRNKPGNGFFDKYGYIPVHTGDVIEIGGSDHASTKEKTIDTDFEKKFLTRPDGSIGPLDEEAYKRYEASDEGKKDKQYVDEFHKKNPTAQLGKQMSDAEIQSLMERVEGSGIGKKIAEVAIKMASLSAGDTNNYMPKCCWDWISKMYKLAGAKPGKTIYHNLRYEGKVCPDENKAPQSKLDQITAGDWIYYNNRNTVDTHGNHSVLFIEWVNPKEDGVARVASGSATSEGKDPARVHLAKLKEKGVTHIQKPAA